MNKKNAFVITVIIPAYNCDKFIERCISNQSKGVQKAMVDKPEIIETQRFEDFRGWFSVPVDRSIDFHVVQINQGFSRKAGTLRGLHFQEGEHAQAKLVSCLHGSIFNVAVDLRPGETYGHAYSAVLSFENQKQMLIPRGFAHGFLVLSDSAEFCYKCDDVYHPGDEDGLMWNDPTIGIEWPALDGDGLFDESQLVLSDKDRRHPPLSALRNSK